MAEVILFIDDEELYARRYINHLEKQEFVVHYCDRAEDAQRFLEQNTDIRGIVLDIMMPTPETVSDQVTNHGLDTGLWVLQQLKDYVICKPRPVLILTNRHPQIVEDGVRRVGLPSWLVEVRRKVETPAFYLPKHLGAFLEQARKRYRDEQAGGDLS
jgi:CheY-like chemotaxis protein